MIIDLVPVKSCLLSFIFVHSFPVTPVANPLWLKRAKVLNTDPCPQAIIENRNWSSPGDGLTSLSSSERPGVVVQATEEAAYRESARYRYWRLKQGPETWKSCTTKNNEGSRWHFSKQAAGDEQMEPVCISRVVFWTFSSKGLRVKLTLNKYEVFKYLLLWKKLLLNKRKSWHQSK